MIRLVCVAIAFSLLIGCDKVGNNEPEIAGDNMHVDDFSVTEVKYNGKSHQYLVWWAGNHRSGITHLPDCKYCKGNNR